MASPKLPTWKALAEGCEFSHYDWWWLVQQARRAVPGFNPNRYGHLVQGAMDRMLGGLTAAPGVTVLRFGNAGLPRIGWQSQWTVLARAAERSSRDLQILIRKVWHQREPAGKIAFGRPKRLTDVTLGTYDVLFKDMGQDAVLEALGPLFSLLHEEVGRSYRTAMRDAVQELLALGATYAELDELLRGELVRTVHVV